VPKKDKWNIRYPPAILVMKRGKDYFIQRITIEGAIAVLKHEAEYKLSMHN
jgi:hypothetical protein